VQIHQVARVRGDAEVSEENSVEAVLVPQLAAMPWYTYAHGNGNSIGTESGQQQRRAPGLLGRCFREALHGQVRGHPSSVGAWVWRYVSCSGVRVHWLTGHGGWPFIA